MRKKHTYHGKSMSINFPGFPDTIGFVTFMGKHIHFSYTEVYHKMGVG